MPDYHGTIRVTFIDDFEVEAPDEDTAIVVAEGEMRTRVGIDHPSSDIEEVEVQDISED